MYRLATKCSEKRTT